MAEIEREKETGSEEIEIRIGNVIVSAKEKEKESASETGNEIASEKREDLDTMAGTLKIPVDERKPFRENGIVNELVLPVQSAANPVRLPRKNQKRKKEKEIVKKRRRRKRKKRMRRTRRRTRNAKRRKKKKRRKRRRKKRRTRKRVNMTRRRTPIARTVKLKLFERKACRTSRQLLVKFVFAFKVPVRSFQILLTDSYFLFDRRSYRKYRRVNRNRS